MKALKISNTVDGLRLARCLIGSKIYQYSYFDVFGDFVEGFVVYSNTKIALVGIRSNNKIIIEVAEGNVDCESIILPIDTLVLNPFSAMREAISIRVTDAHKRETFTGSISNSGISPAGEWCFGIASDSENMDYYKEEITLDISAACILDGVEEVGI